MLKTKFGRSIEAIQELSASSLDSEEMQDIEIDITKLDTVNFETIKGIVDSIQHEVINKLQFELHKKLGLTLTPTQKGCMFKIALQVCWIEQFMRTESIIVQKERLFQEKKSKF